MNPSRIFILRPVATSLLMAAILLVGIVAALQLAVSALPEVDFPTIQIITFYPGASPDVMASAVTAPLERQFGEVPGLNQMTSISSGGSSVITLQFALYLNIDVAEQEVQAAINSAQTYLPPDLPAPPIYSKSNPADAPILTLALTSKTIPLSTVEDLADTRLAQKISQLSGVGLVTIVGGQKPAVRIQANPTQLSSYGLNLEDLRSALAATSVNQAKGNFDGPELAYQINANDQLSTSADYNKVVIAYRNGAPVMLSDVAKAVDGAENQKQAAWMNSTPSIIVNVQRQPGANIIQVVDRIIARLPQLKATLPPSVDVQILTDRTTTIRASVRDVFVELIITGFLVVAVIYLFLRTLSATIIPAVALPLSIIGTFAIMYLLGYSLNNLTLMALTISTGFVVDDAIVMIENIVRYIEEGEKPLNAALKGAQQIGFTIMSLTISLVAVLIPLLFMSDIVGRLFREFAVTLSVTILVSAVVSLTLTPMMCARLLKKTDPSKQGRVARASEHVFDRMVEFYGRTLRFVLNYRATTLLVFVATVVLTVVLYILVPKGFFPVQDTGVIQGISQASQNASFDAMAAKQQELAQKILKDPAVASLSSFIGVDGINTTLNSGRILINLKPIEDRDASASEIIRRLQPQLDSVNDISLYMSPVQDLTVEDRVSRTQYQYTLEDPDPNELQLWTGRLMDKLQDVKILRDLATDQQMNGMAVQLVIDRVTAARLGISAAQIDSTLYDAFGQRQVSTLFTQLNQYHLIMEAMPSFQKNPNKLNDIYVQSASGGSVPLSAFCHFENKTAPLSINHQGQFPCVTLSFNIAPGASLGEATKAIEDAQKELNMPASVQTAFQGTAASFQASLSNEPLLILAALITVYIVLGVLYESYIHPITILSTLPSAGVGAILALMLFHQDLNVVSLIGIILLIGIVKKNGIMMVDFALQAEREEGKNTVEAIYQSCMLRFRPIMMTTMTALLGGLPLALGSGTGSELRRPLGISMVGGLILSQILTLYTTPVIYIYLDRFTKKKDVVPAAERESSTPGSSRHLMSFSATFIHRPVATTLLTTAVALAGAVAFRLLPVAPLPQVDYPTITVGASLPGGSPEIMASAVAAPLEKQFGHIAGVTEMTSISTLGSTGITLQFDLNRNIDGAARDVQAAINAARTYLPANLPSNPSWRKVNPADAPIMILAMTSDIYTKGQMYDIASSIIQQRLSQVDGVGQVFVGGSSLPAVRVDVNPVQLENCGLSLTNVQTVLRGANANAPKGQISNGNVTYDILANDQLLKADYYKPLVVGYHNGAAVRLQDVADVQDSIQDVRTAGYADGKPAVMVIIFKQPQANIIDTVDRVREALPALKASAPSGITETVTFDRTTTIRASVHDVEITLLISILLVILVVFVFLRDVRTTLIPSVAVPVSLIGTFGVMYLLGYSLDNLSLMALTISTGFVVDDAIVVIENITRYLEQGMPPMQAALKGAGEIGFTVLSISVSLVTVFAPILMMGGLVGRLFREFAVTISVAIMVSLVVSLTTTPMMCARLLKRQEDQKHGRIHRATGAVFDWILSQYEKSLRAVLQHPYLVLFILLLTIASNFLLISLSPRGFFPEQDTGMLSGTAQGSEDTSFQAMAGIIQQYIQIVRSDPDVDHLVGFTGGSGGGTTVNQGRMFISLKPLGVRTNSAQVVANRLRGKCARVRGATCIFMANQDIRVGGRTSRGEYQYTIDSDSLSDLSKWGPILVKTFSKIPGLTDVNSDQQDAGLQSELTYDRPTAFRMGLTASNIDGALYGAFGQSLASTMYTSLNQYYVVMEVAPKWWQSPSSLNDIYLQSKKGGEVPLAAITRLRTDTAPIEVNHQGQFPCVTISFNLAPGMSLGDAVEKIDAAEQDLRLPTNIHGNFAGTAQVFQSSMAGELWLVGGALLAVYIVLGILYESYIHPITILSTLPSAGVGALIFLLFFKLDLTIIAVIGIILLIGIVKKNGILMVDFAIEAERSQGLRPEDAIFQASILRFRPILMTTMAATCGALPLVLSTGTGSEMRRPLGVAIVGGLLFSQALTLYTTPVVYLLFDRLGIWLRKQRGLPPHAQPAPALA